MAILDTPVRRAAAAAGFAFLALAAPAAVAATVPAAPHTTVGACSGGEEEDPYTDACVPHSVPNSGSPFSSTGANPDVSSIGGVPCTGGDTGKCIGLQEDQPDFQKPTPIVGSDPTVTGSQ